MGSGSPGMGMGMSPPQHADPFQGMPMSEAGGGVAMPPMGGSGDYIPEMNKLREWEDKHEKELEEMSRKEAASKDAIRKKAAEDLQKFYDERKENIKKKQATNKAEQATIEQSRDDASKTSGNPWVRVTDLIDTSARASDESRDTARMRALLIQLKTNPIACS